jgi:F-type H+-transporting ATPase subunit a
MSEVPNPLHEAQDHHGKWVLFENFPGVGEISIPLLSFPHPLHWANTYLGIDLFPERFVLTKFMILEVLAAAFLLYIFIPLARKIHQGGVPRGIFHNLFESILVFIRNEVARPVLGAKEGDRLVPYLWTVFLFILVCNLLGMVPLLGSPTASIWMTGSLALCSFFLFHAIPIARLGFIPYLKSMWMHIDFPVLGPLVSVFIFVMELLGTVIKGGVLAVRLFANIFAGHVALATLLLFAWNASFLSVGNAGVSLLSVFAGVMLSLLELLVAFLQAYVFTFLTCLFIGLPLTHAHEHDQAEDHSSTSHGEHSVAPASVH